jgi:TRAP-type C4-dicarboxylate transport system permease small subunit
MKIINWLISVSKFFVMVATVLIMLLIVADVFLRWVFNSPILGVVEYSSLLMVIVLLGTASTAQENSHIKIDILYNKFPPKVRAICDMFTLTLSFAISMLIATQAFSQGLIAANFGMRFVTIGVQRAPFFFLFSASFLILCLAIIGLLIDAGKTLKSEFERGKELQSNE